MLKLIVSIRQCERISFYFMLLVQVHTWKGCNEFYIFEYIHLRCSTVDLIYFRESVELCRCEPNIALFIQKVLRNSFSIQVEQIKHTSIPMGMCWVDDYLPNMSEWTWRKSRKLFIFFIHCIFSYCPLSISSQFSNDNWIYYCTCS